MRLSDAARLTEGDRVRVKQTKEEGTVQRSVVGRSPGSSYLVVRWDKTGSVGRHNPALLEKIG